MSAQYNRKICLLRMNRAGAGGAENYLARLSTELERIGCRHHVIHAYLPRKLLSWVRILLYAFFVCISKRRRFYFSLERIWCADIYRAGDGVHKEHLKVKGLSLNPLHPFTLILERFCLNNAKHIIANSEMVRQQIIHHYKISPEKISVIYSGVDLDVPRPDGRAIRSEFGLPADSKIILYVGSGFARKGVAEMLNLLSKLPGNYRAFIVGGDTRLSHYQNLTAQHGIADKVTFTGTRSDVNNFYAAADIVLLPTRYEPFSNVVLEAMRFDNAIVTTRQNGAAEILDDALIMAHSKDESILETLQRLLTDKAWLQEIKNRNLEKIREFSINKNAVLTWEIIQRVMNKNSRLTCLNDMAE